MTRVHDTLTEVTELVRGLGRTDCLSERHGTTGLGVGTDRWVEVDPYPGYRVHRGRGRASWGLMFGRESTPPSIVHLSRSVRFRPPGTFVGVLPPNLLSSPSNVGTFFRSLDRPSTHVFCTKGRTSVHPLLCVLRPSPPLPFPNPVTPFP